MYNYILFRRMLLRNCDAETKNAEIALSKMCARSAKIDYSTYKYISLDLETTKELAVQ